MPPEVHTTDIGTISYKNAWALQESLQKSLIARKRTQDRTTKTPKPLPDGYLLFVEHPHVYTIGKSGKWDNLIFSDDILAQKGIEVVKSDRGGDITYHGPGQIVGYPVLDLERFGIGVARYIEMLEEVIIRTAAHFGITAKRFPSRAGVWVDNNKLCALGIKCSRYVTMHGFALNVRTDLDYFQGIIPCGLDHGGVTAFDKLLADPPETDEIRSQIVLEFERVFRCSIRYQASVPGSV